MGISLLLISLVLVWSFFANSFWCFLMSLACFFIAAVSGGDIIYFLTGDGTFTVFSDNAQEAVILLITAFGLGIVTSCLTASEYIAEQNQKGKIAVSDSQEEAS